MSPDAPPVHAFAQVGLTAPSPSSWVPVPEAGGVHCPPAPSPAQSEPSRCLPAFAAHGPFSQSFRAIDIVAPQIPVLKPYPQVTQRETGLRGVAGVQ